MSGFAVHSPDGPRADLDGIGTLQGYRHMQIDIHTHTCTSICIYESYVIIYVDYLLLHINVYIYMYMYMWQIDR